MFKNTSCHMKKCLLLIVLCSFLLLSKAAFGQRRSDLIGTWHNKSKATLNITSISPGGQLSGTYIAVDGDAKRTFPINGWVNPVPSGPKSAHVVPVLFTVRVDPLGSTAFWAGYLSRERDGRFSITTIWKVVRADDDPDALSHSATDVAVFKPGPAL
jgi:hypothetical protein